MQQSKIIEFYHGGCVLERVTETFTHRCENGEIVLRGDPKDSHWAAFYSNGSASSWFGVPPNGWDKTKAVEDNWTRTFEREADYS